jgi:protein TonB
MTFSEKNFYNFLLFSAVLHLLMLTVIITKPSADDLNKPFKELKIKLGNRKTTLEGVGRDLSENLYFKQAQPAIAPSPPPQEARNAVTPAVIEQAPQAQPEAQEPEKAEEAQLPPAPKETNKKTLTAERQMDMLRALEPASPQVLPIPKTPKPQPKITPSEEEGQGFSLGDSNDEDAQEITDSYGQPLAKWFQKFSFYPEEAQEQGLKGHGKIFVKIDRKGKILLSRIIESTGEPILDKALIQMIRDADPVIPVPPEYYPDKKTFSYEMGFEF